MVRGQDTNTRRTLFLPLGSTALHFLKACLLALSWVNCEINSESVTCEKLFVEHVLKNHL